jgi:hypothetical protein
MGSLQLNNDNVITIMIILVVLIIIKPILYFFSIINSKNNIINQETFEKISLMYTYILDIIVTFIAVYILFFRKNNSIITIILATLAIFKTIVTFSVDFELYEYVNLSNDTINSIQNYKNRSVLTSNIFLFFVAGYILTKIFYK